MYRVAIVGAAGTGKSTHARLLQKKLGGDVLSFATPVKKVTRELFGEAMDDPHFARRANQMLGDGVRQLDMMTWVRLLLAKVPETRNTFIDDARYYNEYVALKSLGFRFIRVAAAPSVLHERRPEMTESELNHASELEAASIPTETVFRTDVDPVEDVHERILAYLKGTHHGQPGGERATLSTTV